MLLYMKDGVVSITREQTMALQAAFSEICAARAPPSGVSAGVYWMDGRGKEVGRLEHGPEVPLTNCYSMTKSLFGLVVAHDVLYDGFDATFDVSEYLRLFWPGVCIDADHPVRFCDLLNHRAGLNEIDFSDVSTLFNLLFRHKDSHSFFADYLRCAAGGAAFQYSPVLGYMLAGAIYELVKREKQGPGAPLFSIANRCSELFFPKGMECEWRTCAGASICMHTLTFSEFRTDRKSLRLLAQNLMRNHRPLLDFITSQTHPRKQGLYVHRARSASASGGLATGGGGDEVVMNYDYSLGWWILPGCDTLCAIGLGGQYIVLCPTIGVFGVRQQPRIMTKERIDPVAVETIGKRRSFISNTHETYPLLVRRIDSGIDPDTERRLTLSRKNVVLYFGILDCVSGARQWIESDLAPLLALTYGAVGAYEFHKAPGKHADAILEWFARNKTQ
jgi:CubicO group peptidase (beta-lactamase class C family)